MKIWRLAFQFSTEQSLLLKYYKFAGLLKGRCETGKTLKYSKRNPLVNADHWSHPLGLGSIYMSSVAVGTLKEEVSIETDQKLFDAIVQNVVSGGVNVIDTCVSYRQGRSEKVINSTLQYLTKEKGFERGQLIVFGKCGFIPTDADSDLDQDFFINLATTELSVPPEEIVDKIHCVHPKFIDFSVAKSLHCIGVETIDVMFLNGFADFQKQVLDPSEFERRLRSAFKALEALRKDGKIQVYGLCENSSFRIPHTQKNHLSLQNMSKIAKEVGGVNHGFKFIMLPFNLGLPEALLKFQQYEQNGISTPMSIFDVAAKEEINVVTNLPLMQGKIANVPFQKGKLSSLKYNTSQHIQLIRSYSPSSHVTTVIGHMSASHITENLEVIEHARLTEEEWRAVLPY